MPRGVFFLFMAVGLACAGGSLFYYGWALSRVFEARDWPQAVGTIRSSSVEDRYSSDSDGGTSVTHYPRIAYTYRVGGRELVSERVWLTGNDFFNDRADAVAFVQDYPPGIQVPIHYDPARPSMATLVLNFPPWQIFFLTVFGLTWIWAGIYFRFFTGTSRRAKPRTGKCRGCGARLAFSEHMQVDQMRTVTEPYFDDDGRSRTRNRIDVQYRHRPCPKCGDPEPLKSLRNNPGMILFLVMFFGIVGTCLYFLFFF
jgi:hypothetical protein